MELFFFAECEIILTHNLIGLCVQMIALIANPLDLPYVTVSGRRHPVSGEINVSGQHNILVASADRI
jgi:hypothetical protein